MIEPINFYEYYTSRNLLNEKGKSPNSLKVKLIKKIGIICYICRKQFYFKNEVQLEHLIPVAVGGHLFSEENCFLCCLECHNKKTNLDIKAINIMKKIGIIRGNVVVKSFFDIDYIIKFYLNLINTLKTIEEREKIIHYGNNNINYIHIIQYKNRE